MKRIIGKGWMGIEISQMPGHENQSMTRNFGCSSIHMSYPEHQIRLGKLDREPRHPYKVQGNGEPSIYRGSAKYKCRRQEF